MTTGDSDSDDGVSRRSFVLATGALAGTGLLGAGGTGAAAAGDAPDPRFYNWRTREAMHAWERGYRGRADRAVALTDTGVDARHPDTGPWNGVRAVTLDGELTLVDDAETDLQRVELDAGESFSGTIGPGTFATPATQRHAFVAPDGADEVSATLSWSPDNLSAEGTSVGEDLEFYVEDADGERVATAATANNPETLTVNVEGGAAYAFVVETYVNATADYEIAADYYRYEGTIVEYDGDPTAGIDPADPDAPKVVGWYDPGSRYGRWDAPRDPNGHGTHCSSIMAGSGRASALDPDTVTRDSPQTTLVLGEVLDYRVEADAGTGVYASAYGTGIELVIEGPDGQQLAASTATSDASTWDNNVVEAHTVHGSGTATYAVYVRAIDGELATAATVDEVQVGAFLGEGETVGDRLDSGDESVHAGLAPNSSVVGLQGLGGATADLARYADEFAGAFNVRAVNMSWGYVGGAPLGAAGGLLAEDPSLVKDISSAGILVSAAAGNAATPANGNGAPGIADETISVVATGPLDGIASYSSGGLAGYDEDGDTVYRKPDVTAPGGSLTDLARAAEAGAAGTAEGDQEPIRDYTGKAGTSMAAPYVTGISGLVAEAMESDDAPASIRLPEPADAGLDDVLRLKQAVLATATETALTAAPYHRAHVPTYDFGARDPYEGFGRANPGAAVDAATRELSGASSEVVGLNVPDDERAAAGYVDVEPGTYEVSVSFSHYAGGNAGATKGSPHLDLFVYDAANPAAHGEPNVIARTQALQGSGSVSFTTPDGGTFYVVAKLVNVPGVVNGHDVQAHFDLGVETLQGFHATGSRSDDGSVFTGGQTNQVDLAVESSEAVRVRDVVPSAWTVLTDFSGDVSRVEQAGDVQYVYLDGNAESVSGTYFAEAPSTLENSGEYAFGPVEVSADGDTWVQLAGTSDTNVVLGQST